MLCNSDVQLVMMLFKHFTEIRVAAIATGYGMDGLVSITGKRKNYLFFRAFRPSLGHTQPPVHWVLGGCFPGDEAPVALCLIN
jgi:hypothetical protein